MKRSTLALPTAPTTGSTMLCRILVVRRAPDRVGRAGRDDDQLVLVLHVQEGRVVALPVGVGAAAVEAEHEVDLVARLVALRAVEEVGAPRLHLDRVARLGDDRASQAVSGQ